MAVVQSPDAIPQLLEAERKAQELVATAKRNRQALIRQAKDKAEEDVEAFKQEQEERFRKEAGLKAAQDPAAELKGSTQQAVDAVHKDYAANKGKTVDFIVEKVLDVSIALSDTQKMVLKMGKA
eukprot:TRINITY_DN5102_c1_g1_i1.p2 TRINITY_DN5102_c1_g1~~TRINITY_DN5102_c1_g1_i1.p2  ORF type:complete len:124 (-),score=52.50 TRINITY_DN5102_c1_g1_i1:79-450(-)